MRILHLLDEPYDSGIVSYALSAGRALAARGHWCGVWAPEGSPALAQAQASNLQPFPFAHAWLDLAKLRDTLHTQRVELAVAHTGSTHTVAALACSDRLPLLRTRGDARPIRRRPGFTLLWRRTAGFVAANGAILQEYRSLLPEGPPGERIYQGGEDPGPARPPASGALVVGMLGRLDPVKGHDDFLRAAARLRETFPDARFLIAGREENVKAVDLRRLCRELGLEGRAEWVGHVPDAAEFMGRCHVGVLASRGSEAVSRAAVEWMAAGRPLVASAVGCLPEYVLAGRTGLLVPPGEPKRLADSLGSLLGDPWSRETMGRAARERYEELFTLDRFAAATEGFYERTLHAVSSR